MGSAMMPNRSSEAAAAPGGALVIGTDCPALAPGHLREAAAALREHDAALVPAEDGGYVLIGMKRCHPALFERVEWGSATGLATTRARAAERRLRLRTGPATPSAGASVGGPAAGPMGLPLLRLERLTFRFVEAGFVATIRKTRGDDIDAACGQLAGGARIL